MLSCVEQVLMEDVFEMHNGYVLNFQSKKKFQSFICECIGIDIMTASGYVAESSMAKKLRYLIKHENDSNVSKVLLALLEIREQKIKALKDEDLEYTDKYADAAKKILREAEKMSYNRKAYSSDEKRLDADLKSAESVLDTLVPILEDMVNNKLYTYDRKENEFNDYIRDALKRTGYPEIRDQTRHGESENRKDAGEVDILLTKEGKETALVECLKLTCVDTTYLQKHIQKATLCYNPLGTATFIVIYAGADKFGEFWKRLESHLAKYDFGLKVHTPLQDKVPENAAIRVSNLTFEKDGFAFPVYFIAVNVLK